MYGDDAVDNAQRYDHEASEREARHDREEAFRSDLPDYEDEACEQVEQERNITHALDNAI